MTSTQDLVADSLHAAGRLRVAVRANALYCACSGIFMALGAGLLDDGVGLHAAVLVIVGVSLVGYGAMLWWGTAQEHLLQLTGRIAVAGDLGWILMAIVVIGLTDLLTTGGAWMLAALTVVVAAFFVVQTRLLVDATK